MSSNSCASRRRDVRCFYDLDSPLTTAWTTENHGRRFNGCGLYKACKGGDFVSNELKKKDNMKLKQDEDLKKKLKFCK
nr:hypothetical protein MtrDRAFT_AC148396g14v2 [Medicago truncatula]